MRSRKRTIPIADDNRARVPFAMIGALILVSSVGLVVTLQLQRDATVDVDDSLAMERTASAANTALFDATTQATHDAALEPVTEPADTELGRAISDDRNYTGDEFFERYVKLRIYLEAQENFASSGQQFREMDTSISIDPVEGPDDVEDAIDSVSLVVGGNDTNETLTTFEYGDDLDTGLGHGTIEVTIDDVEFTVEREGEVVAERTQPISVTVGTPLFDLHHRTSEYEAQLNYDFADAQAADEYAGFDQYFASRLYPLAWERGYAQSEGEPIADVIANRHVKTLANDALYQTQRSVFGADDPDSDRRLTTAYTCMLAQDANHVYETPDGGSSDVDTVLERVNETEFCDGLGYGHDEFDEEFTDPPDWTQLASQNGYLNETETINLDDVSSTVYGELEEENGIERAIDRIYTVDVAAEYEDEITTDLHQYEDGTNRKLLYFDVDVVDSERLINVDETGTEREFYEFTLHFDGFFERDAPDESATDVSVNYEVTLTISGEHSPADRVTRRGIDYDYKAGPSTEPGLQSDRNFQRVPEMAVEEVFTGVDNPRNAQNEIEAYFEQRRDEIIASDAILDADDFVDELTGGQREWTLGPEPRDREQLRAWLVDELDALETETSAVGIEPERQKLLRNGSTFDELMTRIDDDSEWAYQYVDGDHYANVPDKVRAEVYLEYMERLRDRVAEAQQRHEAIVGEFDDELEGHTNTGIEPVTEFAVSEFDRDPPTGATELPAYPLLEGIEFVPEGSPSYVTLNRVTREQVPAVGESDHGFAPAAAMNDDIYGVPFDDVATSGVQLRVAGEVLDAGYEADNLSTTSDWDEGAVDGLEESLDRWIDDYSTAAGAHAAEPFAEIDQAELAAAIDEEIRALGPVDRQAIELGGGAESLDRIAENVSEEFEVPDRSEYGYHVLIFRAHLEHSVRNGLDAALGDQGVVTTHGVPGRTAALGAAVRAELADANRAILDERLEQAAASSLGNETLTATEAFWLDGTNESAPNRVSSGTSVVDIPMWHVLTANIWHIEFEGEYARFTTRATEGAAGSQPMTYVREDAAVTLEIGDASETVGRIDPIGFESQISVPVAVPEDGYGVGDRAGDRLECSETYDEVGTIADADAFDACG